MIEKIVNQLRRFRFFTALIWLVIGVLRKFAWFLNPILLIFRFWKIQRIDNRIANWCFESEKNIESIVKNRPHHYMIASFEIHYPNSTYGYAKILKNYVGLPETYPIKVCYSHFASFHRTAFSPKAPFLSTYNFDIPVFLACGRFEEENMRTYRPKNLVYVIGSPFLYAESFFSDEYIKQEKTRLGKNLLVFPSHSTLSSCSVYNVQEFLDSIMNKYKNQFDTIRICLYWRDIELNRHQFYIEKGFELVSAGNSLDYNFIPRLKGLLQICDAITTNSLGTHVGYSISLNKPVSMLQRTSHNFHNLDKNMLKFYSEENYAPEYKILEELLLSNEELKITDEVREIIELFWGLNEKKTKEELRQIFFEAEMLFRKSPYRHRFLKFR
jgi:hypothetical protein